MTSHIFQHSDCFISQQCSDRSCSSLPIVGVHIFQFNPLQLQCTFHYLTFKQPNFPYDCRQEDANRLDMNTETQSGRLLAHWYVFPSVKEPQNANQPINKQTKQFFPAPDAYSGTCSTNVTSSRTSAKTQ